MATATVEIPDERMPDLEAYKDRLGELLLLGLSQMKIQEAPMSYQHGLRGVAADAEGAESAQSHPGQASTPPPRHPRRL